MTLSYNLKPHFTMSMERLLLIRFCRIYSTRFSLIAIIFMCLQIYDLWPRTFPNVGTVTLFMIRTYHIGNEPSCAFLQDFLLRIVVHFTHCVIKNCSAFSCIHHNMSVYKGLIQEHIICNPFLHYKQQCNIAIFSSFALVYKKIQRFKDSKIYSPKII